MWWGMCKREGGGKWVEGNVRKGMWWGISKREWGGENVEGNVKKGDEETVVMEKGKRGGNCGEGNKEGDERGVVGKRTAAMEKKWERG